MPLGPLIHSFCDCPLCKFRMNAGRPWGKVTDSEILPMTAHRNEDFWWSTPGFLDAWLRGEEVKFTISERKLIVSLLGDRWEYLNDLTHYNPRMINVGKADREQKRVYQLIKKLQSEPTPKDNA